MASPSSSKWLLSLLLSSFTCPSLAASKSTSTTTDPTCYSFNGTPNSDYQLCPQTDAKGMCCLTGTKDQPADVCLQNGLCQTVAESQIKGQTVRNYSYWRGYCTSRDWEGGGCLGVCLDGSIYIYIYIDYCVYIYTQLDLYINFYFYLFIIIVFILNNIYNINFSNIFTNNLKLNTIPNTSRTIHQIRPLNPRPRHLQRRQSRHRRGRQHRRPIPLRRCDVASASPPHTKDRVREQGVYRDAGAEGVSGDGEREGGGL
ncbi:hypothetical protein P170DRAFT_423965 [Aspergillus steynii IBT 23096]|uniref:Uncharacterized protein n=1 Tax=Aspergillus steynii IBT 23096 TaxID=1392250 RepID=A0A2I2GK13_9EURO|nr:uncharacterized protein P170DRAFT_423965 [Aspergillus steynii IBT 23096]PLB53197.1 hypothetical protein P170DRAFT_423965 [Aspergillus steynii IBT 23096]